MTLKRARHLAKKNESDKRFAHTLNVEKMAVKLAKKYDADPEQAALAALLHDCVKEKPKDELLHILQENAIIADDAQNRPSSVWHGVCASILAQTKWDVTDPAVLSAVACHTTGKENMSKLDKIIYLADMLCEERDFKGVEPLRELAYQDLDLAMGACLAHTVQFLAEDGKPIDPASFAAYQEYAKKREEQKHE